MDVAKVSRDVVPELIFIRYRESPDVSGFSIIRQRKYMPTNFTNEKVVSILENWNISRVLLPSKHQGLINHTWLVGKPTEGVLQWVNPIFDQNIHLDIEAVTSHLLSKGLHTTSLLPTKSGEGYVTDPDGGFWSE